MLINGTEWLAIAAIGEEDAPVHVNDIWITKSSDVPATRWPGTTWEKIENRMILGSGTRAVNATGGEESHALTALENAAHSHALGPGQGFGMNFGSNAGGGSTFGVNVGFTNANTYQGSYQAMSTGEGQPHNNMPPYRVFHQWLRLS